MKAILKRKINSFIILRKKIGISGTLIYLWRRYVNHKDPQLLSTSRVQGRTDIIGFYQFLKYSPFGNAPSLNTQGMKTINWVIPDFGIGSGGHLNIFRLIYLLEQRGYLCRVIIAGHTHCSSNQEARKLIRKHFFPINAQVSLGEKSLEPAAITVATSWTTAYPVRNFQGTLYRCYFVQDYEPYFHAHGSDYAFAETTYNMGFYGITAGDWLAEKLAVEHGMKTFTMGFSYDKTLYRPSPRREPEIKRIFFYARPVTCRRGFELGLLAIDLVVQKMPDIACILAGWDASSYHIPFNHLNAGNVAIKDLPDLYSQCDVALVISLTNLSLLPLELMACGCPVVSNRGKNVEWLLNDKNAVLADATPEALSEALLSVLKDENQRQQLLKESRQFASNTSWELEAQKVGHFFDELLLNEVTP